MYLMDPIKLVILKSYSVSCYFHLFVVILGFVVRKLVISSQKFIYKKLSCVNKIVNFVYLHGLTCDVMRFCLQLNLSWNCHFLNKIFLPFWKHFQTQTIPEILGFFLHYLASNYTSHDVIWRQLPTKMQIKCVYDWLAADTMKHARDFSKCILLSLTRSGPSTYKYKYFLMIFFYYTNIFAN